MERARINGINIAYELRGSGAPLVMIHGAQGDQTMFAGMAAAFAPRYRVLTFDQRGTGLSDNPDRNDRGRHRVPDGHALAATAS